MLKAVCQRALRSDGKMEVVPCGEKSEGQPVATTRKEERVLGVVARLLYWLSENDAFKS
jgi:hypothetical protein